MNIIINGTSTTQTAQWLTFDEIARLVGIAHPTITVQPPGREPVQMGAEESVTLVDGMSITAVAG